MTGLHWKSERRVGGHPPYTGERELFRNGTSGAKFSKDDLFKRDRPFPFALAAVQGILNEADLPFDCSPRAHLGGRSVADSEALLGLATLDKDEA